MPWPSEDQEFHEVEGVLLRRTDKAILLQVDSVEGWVPISLLHPETVEEIENIEDGEEGEFSMQDWIAEKNGFV